MNQSCKHVSGCAAAASVRASRSPFFKADLRLGIGPRVVRTDLLPRQAHPAQHPRQARRMVSLTEARLQPPAQVRTGPRRYLIRPRVGTTKDGGRKRRFLGFAQLLRRMALRAVTEPGQAFAVVPDDRAARSAWRSIPASRAA